MNDKLYTARDPHYEVTCANCRFGSHHACVGTMELVSPFMGGTYRCACTKCLVKGSK